MGAMEVPLSSSTCSALLLFKYLGKRKGGNELTGSMSQGGAEQRSQQP